MNIVVLNRRDWQDEQHVRLFDRRADHIRAVLRAAVGDSVRVGELNGLLGHGRICAIDADSVALRVELSQPPPPRHRFDVVLSLPRPKVLRRLFRTVAEYGVANLHLIHSARVEKSYWQSPLLAPDKVHDALLAGMERASDTVVPQVHQYRRFRPFVEDQLKDICAGRPCWIAQMGASLALRETPPRDAVVMVGPEGGFVPFELELAQAVLAQPVHLGSRTLSVDTALTSALAQG
ncbi:16S rRNA (uracil(1498)-N(3))-methyltransferase [Synechococcus sp. PROS-U-1]|uniref:16S rRNA (uracil(1498)-N(3))-methyltransferase n=1 Tax=Synechococcus sp. PROS-U-1 TaxID=1400866 RepID=UPI001646F458|nr:16S rRNA (uracil(1498)-N(3))-methyltransferase [Synechococcus sp. PROS-U-1]QNJ03510.1 RNA methyltransferase/ RsmE family protein [Synechococcus sp. PROS-U-1]